MVRPFPWITAQFWTLLAWFIAIDLCFIAIHAGGWATFRLGWTGEIPYILRISEDRTIPESFNYLKWAIIVVSLAWIGIRDRWVLALAWALVFLLLLLDDSLSIHEAFGIFFAENFNFGENPFLEPGDLGELLYAAIMGGLVLSLAIWAVLRAEGASRRLSLAYLLVIVTFGFFSVFVDAAHRSIINALPGIAVLQDIFAVIEEGGEMFVASTAAALTLAPLAWLAGQERQPMSAKG